MRTLRSISGKLDRLIWILLAKWLFLDKELICFKNREQRTENREQRTENREQRTENREQKNSWVIYQKNYNVIKRTLMISL